MKTRSKLASKLGIEWLWWKWSYAFRWAHKPLCGRFRQDVLKVGGVYLCRSCTLLFTGALLTPLVVGLVGVEINFPFVLVTWLVTLAGSYPSHYRHLRRSTRDFMRFLLGVSLAMIVVSFLVGWWVEGIFGVGVFLVVGKIYQGLRRKAKAMACEGCPELTAGGVCSGYAWQAERIRGYEEEATGRIMPLLRFGGPFP